MSRKCAHKHVEYYPMPGGGIALRCWFCGRRMPMPSTMRYWAKAMEMLERRPSVFERQKEKPK